jgi:hypothetical protein
VTSLERPRIQLGRLGRCRWWRKPFQGRISAVSARNATFTGATDRAQRRIALTGDLKETEMFRIHPRTLLKAALLPTAVLLAAGGSQVAFASQAGATANVTTGAHSALAPDSYYTMQLSPSSVTLRAGYRTRITISFRAPADLYGTPVDLSISGLPGGVTASFAPPTATIGGRAVLTLTAAPSSVAGTFAATVTAMSESSDPIGTSTPLGLTIGAP